MFPVLDNLIENYDFEGKSIFILDIADWAKDIEMVLAGKYSLLSKDAKLLIDKYHMTTVRPIQIHGILYPNEKQDILGKNHQ